MLKKWRKYKKELMNWVIWVISFKIKLMSLNINTKKLLAKTKRVVLIMTKKTL